MTLTVEKTKWVKTNKSYYTNEEENQNDNIYKVQSYYLCTHCKNESIQKIEYLVRNTSDRLTALCTCSLCNFNTMVNYIIIKRTLQIEPDDLYYSFDLERESIFPIEKQSNTDIQQLKEIAPNFVKIHEEADQAYSYGLREISGIGYRKAFDSLIREYACYIAPDKIETITKPTNKLGNIIETYIKDEELNLFAKGAEYLGNDQAHLIIQHENYDIDDLKNLINAFMLLLISIEKRKEARLVAESVVAKKI